MNLEQIADLLGGAAGFQMDQSGVAALRTQHRQHCLAARRVYEQRAFVGLNGYLAPAYPALMLSLIRRPRLDAAAAIAATRFGSAPFESECAIGSPSFDASRTPF